MPSRLELTEPSLLRRVGDRLWASLQVDDLVPLE